MSEHGLLHSCVMEYGYKVIRPDAERHVPMCWKCANSIMETDTSQTPPPSTLVGCKANEDIKDYADALGKCPILPEIRRVHEAKSN